MSQENNQLYKKLISDILAQKVIIERFKESKKLLEAATEELKRLEGLVLEQMANDEVVELAVGT